jgi:putative intracellular protease/amidase
VLFGIFIYDGVEPIDLATYGVLSMAKRIRPEIDICTVSPSGGTVALANGLRVIADYGIATAPPLDVLVVAGGPGWVSQSKAPETLAFIRRQAAAIPVVSVCTGAMILAASGVLDGKPATTKREVVPPEVSPLLEVCPREWQTDDRNRHQQGEHEVDDRQPPTGQDEPDDVADRAQNSCIRPGSHFVAERQERVQRNAQRRKGPGQADDCQRHQRRSEDPAERGW